MNGHIMAYNGCAAVDAVDSKPMPRVLFVCLWLLTIICFSAPGRIGPDSAGSLDVIALVKLGTRVGIFLVLLWMLYRYWRLPERGTVIACLAPLALFAGWAVLSTLWSPLKAVSLGQASSLIVLVLLAMNLGLFCRGAEKTSAVLCSLSVALLAFGVVVLIANLAFPEIGGLSREAPGIVHPTTAGSAASLGIVVLVACRLLWGWKWTRVLLAPGVVVHILLLLIAANRVSLFLTVLLGCALFCVFASRLLVSLFIVVASVAAAVYITSDPGWQLAGSAMGGTTTYVTRGQDADLSDLSGRREMWEAMWESYLRSPWIGHGYFVSSRTGEIYVWYRWTNWTAHNLWLQALVSTGLVGAGLLACGLGFPFLRLLGTRRAEPHIGKVLSLVLFVVGWYFVWGLFNASFLGPIEPESVAFFTILGIAIGHIAWVACPAEQRTTVARRFTDIGTSWSLGRS
ncbi:MAG: O-antigen ligase family protein [Planctomycetes bacterium]|nr:O-antigen ligase family protein [Planctomycetota bacterium]MBL7042542.1 O-antigen ligase family protein [Pirellulaceae bacterium]